MRSKKVLANIFTSLSLQLVSVMCGLIVPRLIIRTYGSGINGLISSILQFLSYIILLESGVGGVVRAALYKPLADNNINKISGIMKATQKFFRVIAFFFIGYAILLSLIFPGLTRNEFNYINTVLLILIISLSTFVQYYFGITNQIILQADQRNYITSVFQIITTIMNTLLVVILVRLRLSIHMVQLGYAIVYIIKPILLNRYVKRKYQIDPKSPADNEAIRQRWDGFGHHIAFFLHSNTDIVVLTLFTNMKEVSVYSVYLMVISGMEKLASTFSTGIEAAFGNMLANGESDAIKRNFLIYEFVSSVLVTVLFTSTALLILPFISIYTKGITDVSYIRPLFAYVFTAAEAFYCIKYPYHSLILAAGHYKQTRNGAFEEAIINIIISIILVQFLGLAGVAFGTLCAMIYRTVQYALYLSKHIIQRDFSIFIKRMAVNLIAVSLTVFTVSLIPVQTIQYYSAWVSYGFEVSLAACLIVFITNALFYRNTLKDIIRLVKRLVTS